METGPARYLRVEKRVVAWKPGGNAGLRNVRGDGGNDGCVTLGIFYDASGERKLGGCEEYFRRLSFTKTSSHADSGYAVTGLAGFPDLRWWCVGMVLSILALPPQLPAEEKCGSGSALELA